MFCCTQGRTFKKNTLSVQIYERLPKFGIIIDTRERQVHEVEDIVVNWNAQYPGATEELPKDMPSYT